MSTRTGINLYREPKWWTYLTQHRFDKMSPRQARIAAQWCRENGHEVPAEVEAKANP